MFRVYYGPGEVRTNNTGVDLGAFSVTELPVADPENMNIRKAIHWFTLSFSLDPNQYTVTIRALFTVDQSDIKWELRPIDRTVVWKRWLDICRMRGWQPVILVQAVMKDSIGDYRLGREAGESSHTVIVEAEEIEVTNQAVNEEVHQFEHEDDDAEAETTQVEPTGQADEAEHIESLLQTMDNEDREGDDAEIHEDEDSADESEHSVAPVPKAWNQEHNMHVNDSHDSPWEYCEIQIGTMYRDKKDLTNAVRQWAMSTQRIFHTDVSDKKYFTARCVAEGCQCKVHAYVPKYEVNWVVSDIVPHTCVRSNVLTEHDNLTSTLIAQLLFSDIVEKKDMEVKKIQQEIYSKYAYRISYGKAWRAKQKALEMRFGSYEDSYHNIVGLLEALQARNPGTYLDFCFIEAIAPYQIMQRAFFALGPCIESFRHCRPLLCVDGTFLTGKFKGQILTAIGVDGNNQIMPLAMAFVESENYSSWVWFFRNLKRGIVRDRPNVCIIHDRHPGILKAVKVLAEPSEEETDPWPDIQSRWCMRHLGANFYSQFRNKRLMKMFKRLCKQNQQRKFDELWKRLDEFTSNEIAQRRRNTPPDAPVNPEDEPRELCALPAIDPPGTRRKKGKDVRKFSQWIQKESLHRWSLLHDTHGARYGIMTTNLAEIYNFVLRGQRALPLVAIVEGVLHGTIRYFQERFQKACMHDNLNPVTPYCFEVSQYMGKKVDKARTHGVRSVGNQELRFEVQLRDKTGFGTSHIVLTHEVKIGMEQIPTCTCTCNKPKLLHLPCSHVIAACGLIRLETGSFVSQYFSKQSVINCWSGEFYGYRLVGNYTKIQNIEELVYIPDFRRRREGRGRRKTRRIRNDMDQSEAGGPTRQCLHCAAYGHRAKYCPQLTTENAPVRGGRASTRGERGIGRGQVE